MGFRAWQIGDHIFSTREGNMSTTAQQEIPAPVAVKTGDFVWHELRTTDAKAATDFYTHVVEWKTIASGDPSGIPYTLLSVGDLSTAGLMQLTPEMQAGGMKPAWVGFIGVDNVDANAKRVEQAGGKLHCEPMDIPGIGRFASAEDPQGATFLLFKGSLEYAPSRPTMGTPGTIGWNELSANDGESAWPFYSELFGWKQDSTMDMGPMGTYRIFNNGGAPIGAVMTRDHSKSPVPFWLYYFNVEDIDAAVIRIQDKKGQVCMGPHQVPGDLWIVVGNDPQGALFALVGPKKQ
jgi:predicted enzyme related to lactoylglutathione lyase